MEELVTFKEAVDTGSIMNASKKLGIQFSTANYHVGKVEEYFGTPLLDRTANGVKLNEDGVRIYQTVDNILGLLEEAKAEITESRNYIRIKMGEIPSILFLKDFLKKLQDVHPDLTIEVKSTSYNECVKGVNTGDVDVAIVGEACMNAGNGEGNDRNMLNHEATEICTDGFTLITPTGHPLSGRDKVTMSDISRYTMICLPSDYGVEMSIRKELKKQLVNVERKTKRIVVENLNQQIHMVASGIGIAITSKLVGAQLEKMGQVRTIPIESMNAERKLFVAFSRYFRDNDLKSDIISSLLEIAGD